MAQRFSFRLENLLRIRRKLEEAAQRDFSRALGLLLETVAKLESTSEKLKGFMRESRFSEGAVFTASEIVAVDNYVALVEHEIERLRSVRTEREAEVARVRHLLNEAKKARKVIENLKERKWERHVAELNREEALELDDVGQKIGLNRDKLTLSDMIIEEM